MGGMGTRLGSISALVAALVAACTAAATRTNDAPDASVRWVQAPPSIHDAEAPRDAGPDTAPIDLEDFHVPGTQMGDVASNGNFLLSSICAVCHSSQHGAQKNLEHSPWETWAGSLMALAGKDPLFYAQLTTANQDVPGVGYYCLRCHVPMSVPTGHAADPSGATLDVVDRDGVACHFCHAMVDPLATDGGAVDPRDLGTVSKLADPPRHYGNAQFVLDPGWLRRGPYSDAGALHDYAWSSSFLARGDVCGTCHDVGNVAVSKLANGGYAYNAPHIRAPDADPRAQFPLERTYTEWKLSAYANGGVDLGGRFGGQGATVVSTCQDCHMPRATGKGCFVGEVRGDLAEHEFAGASAWVIEIAGIQYKGQVDADAIERGKQRAVAMVQRAATLALQQSGAKLRLRVTNESGHKLPTGHIEGRRVWPRVQIFGAQQNVLADWGRWDATTGDLDATNTTVFEMHIGLSADAAKRTGLPAGPTTHMSLADVIVKDNRIPPRGFANAPYEAAGAGAVGATYADGQHWADLEWTLPQGAVRAKVTLYYQTVTREYVEALAKGNHTDNWGQTLEQLWKQTQMGPPIEITTKEIALQ